MKYTEKELPIEKTWVVKQMIWPAMSFGGILLVALGLGLVMGGALSILLPWGITIGVVAVVYCLGVVVKILERANYHFDVSEAGIKASYGVLTKTERNLAYNVVQNVLVVQDIPGAALGLADVVIENAAMGGGAGRGLTMSSGITIPGLSEKNARRLRLLVLERVKQNLVHDLRQGL